jgi:hypothetical protein
VTVTTNYSGHSKVGPVLSAKRSRVIRIICLVRTQRVIMTIVTRKTNRRIPHCRYVAALVVTARRRTRTTLVWTTRLRHRIRRIRKTSHKINTASVVTARVYRVTVTRVVIVTRITRRLVTQRRAVRVMSPAGSRQCLAVQMTLTAHNRDRITNYRCVDRPARVLKIVHPVTLVSHVTRVARALSRVVRTSTVNLDHRVAVLGCAAPVICAVGKVVIVRGGLQRMALNTLIRSPDISVVRLRGTARTMLNTCVPTTVKVTVTTTATAGRARIVTSRVRPNMRPTVTETHMTGRRRARPLVVS